MVQFALNQTIETAEPTITVDPGLPLGQHRFQLVVIDAAGNRSQPAIAVVDIQRAVPIAPTPDLVATSVTPINPAAVTPTRPAVPPSVSPVVSPTPTLSPLASPRSTVTPIAPTVIRSGDAAPMVPHALPESSDVPTSAQPPRKSSGSAKKPKRSPKKPPPPRKEK